MRLMRKSVLAIVFTVAVVCPLILYFRADKSSNGKSVHHNVVREDFLPNANVTKLNPETPKELTDIQSIVETGEQIRKKTNNTVLVTLINDAYIRFTYSWLCNTKHMNIHKQVLFITTDNVSRDKLQKDWPEVSAVTLSGLSHSSGDQVYSHAGYVILMIRRTEALLAMLNANIEMFLFEVDCLWIRNPLPILKNTSTNFDLLVTPVSDRTVVIAGGFLYMRPTKNLKATWQVLTDQLNGLGKRLTKLKPGKYISEADNDQEYLSRLVMKKHGGLTCKILSLEVYPDGKWYSYPESKRKKLDPDIINNNWALGNKAKIDRAKKWHHWFIKDDNVTCDMDAVKKIVKD